MAAAAIVLGVIGFGDVHQPATVPFPDRFYDTLALFSFNQDETPPLPVTLEIARWLAPLAVAYAGFRILAAIFAEHWVRLRVRTTYRGHVIVLGIGRCGVRLATSFQDSGEPVVAVDIAPAEANATECADRGIPLVRGDATDPEVLSRAGLGRARLVLVVCGSEGTNAEAAAAIAHLSLQRRSVLRVLVHIGDTRLSQLLEQAALTTLGTDQLRLEFFNVFRLGPGALLDDWPVGARGNGAPHLVVAGSGPLAVNLVAEAARRWRLARPGARPERLRVTLIAPDAPGRASALQGRVPGLDTIADVTPVAADLADPAGPAPPWPASAGAHDGTTTAFACLDSDADNVQAVIRLRHALPEDVPIVACATGAAGSSLIALLDRSASGYLTNVDSFDLLDEICRPEVLLNLASESIARAVHQNYVRRRLAEGADPASDPALASWPDLPEGLRQSNRDQVADIRAKLDEIGYEFVPAAHWDDRPLEFSRDQVETLAVREHERWLGERRRAGWEYGPQRDARTKHSPYLKPWDELPEDIRERDREVVRQIPILLATAGFALVVKPGRGSDTAGSPPGPLGVPGRAASRP
jgi:TrkA-N domain/RyR domain